MLKTFLNEFIRKQEGVYICIKCGNQYSKKELKKIKDKNNLIKNVTKEEICCLTNTLNIDKLIAKTIFILNSKGYKTKYCCAGHKQFSSPDTYLFFEEPLEPHLKPTFMDYDVYEESKDNKVTKVEDYRVIRHYYNNKVNIQDRIKDINHKLLIWALELPSR